MDETAERKAARMRWWREAKFGLFIHWGLYSIPAGKWADRTDHGEWIMETAQIPVEEYEQLLARFDPINFDPKEWAKLASAAGMKYVVLTTKHHDGFALYDSTISDYDVMATPFRRDIVRELSEAVRAEGLQMGFYYSIMDWHHPAYRPARKWNSRQDGSHPFDEYVSFLRTQVEELLTSYGPIGIIWFDGEWEDSWNDDYGIPLYNLCRRLQPQIIVNNRVSNNRKGSMDSGGDDQRVGDFSTPEQTVPEAAMPGVDWESCMTMNDNWGYNAADNNWKSTEALLGIARDVWGKGGNFLLNVGPKADGSFPDEAVDRLLAMGQALRAS